MNKDRDILMHQRHSKCKNAPSLSFAIRLSVTEQCTQFCIPISWADVTIGTVAACGRPSSSGEDHASGPLRAQQLFLSVNFNRLKISRSPSVHCASSRWRCRFAANLRLITTYSRHHDRFRTDLTRNRSRGSIEIPPLAGVSRGDATRRDIPSKNTGDGGTYRCTVRTCTYVVERRQLKPLVAAVNARN